MNYLLPYCANAQLKRLTSHINTWCEQLIVCNFKKMIKAKMLLLIVLFYSAVAVGQNHTTDTVLIQDLVTSKVDSNQNKKDSIAAKQQLGKLPIKKSQLPELFMAIALLAMIALLRYFYPKFLPEISSQFIKTQVDSRVLKNDKLIQPLPNAYYELMFIILSLVFILFCQNRLMPNSTLSVHKVLISLVSILIFIGFKVFVHWLSGFVFNLSSITSMINFYWAFWRYITTIVLCIAVVILLLLKGSLGTILGIYIPIGFMCISYGFHLFKMIIYTRNNTNITFFEIFTYFCTVEVITLLMLVTFLHRKLL